MDAQLMLALEITPRSKHMTIRSIFILSLAWLTLACSVAKETTKSGAKAELSDEQRLKLQELYINGAKEKILGNYDLSTQYFQQCLKLDPQNGAAHYELAQIKQMQGQEPAALSHAQKAASADPKNKWYLIMLGDRYATNGKLKEAAQQYERLTQLEPYNVDFLYQLAYIYQLSGGIDLSIETYDRVEEITRPTEDVSLQKQRLYQRKGDDAAAAAEVQKLIDAFPGEVRYYGILAELYQESGELDKASEVYEQMKQLDPDNPFLHLALVNYYQQTGQKDRLKGAYRSAFQSSQLDPRTKLEVLRELFGRSMRDTSLSGITRELSHMAVEKHPDDEALQALKGDLLYRDHELDSARSAYRKAVEINGNRPVLWSRILMIDSELLDTLAMEKDSEQAMELFPTIPGFYLFNGMAKLQFEKYNDAISVLTSGKDYVIEDNALLVQFYANLGDAYYSLKQFDSSDQSFEEAIKLDSLNTYVLNNYSYYLSLRKDKLERAATLSKRSNDIDPHSAAYQDTYGWILYQLGNYTEALQWLELALENGGDQSDVILEHVGDALFKMGREKEALDYWKRARQTGKGSDFLDMKLKDEKLYE